MYFIHGGRASGKTVLILKQSAATGIPILTTNYRRISLYKDCAKRLWLNIPEPIIWRNERLPVQFGSRVLIDNGEETLDRILLVNSGVRCETMVISDPVKHLSHSFLENSFFLPEEYRGGRLELLDVHAYGNWDGKDLDEMKQEE